MNKIFTFIIFVFTTFSLFSQTYNFNHNPGENINSRIAVPAGYKRVDVEKKSFEEWLRFLPLKKKGVRVFLYNGDLKEKQNIHYAVVDIDIGKKNLQQCADAIIRLRAEYLFSKGLFEKIHFNFTSGDNASYLNWKNGFRPVISGNTVKWAEKSTPCNSYKTFRNYLDTVFTYAGTASLEKEMTNILSTRNIMIGDVFIKGGHPGHAVIVADLAKNNETGEKIILLLQSYMPAQSIHVLKNKKNTKLNPWFKVEDSGKLYTPEWTFLWTDLHRFK